MYYNYFIIALLSCVCMISFTVCDAYRYFAGQTQLLTAQSMSRTEYLIPTVLD